MTALAVFFVAVGVADACGRLTRTRWLPLALAPIVVIACAALAGLWHRGDIPLLVIAAATGVGWLLLCARAEETGAHLGAPLALFAGTVGLLIVLSGWDSRVTGVVAHWSTWVKPPGIGALDPDQLLMVAGVVLLQLVTGNQLVRLVLGLVGAVKPEGQPQPSDRLKGGRLLGPMERLLILGLGLAGQLAAATAVVAAKSIIRFPEINAQKARENGNIGIDDVTEYFLVGSFASWILALAGIALALSQ
jgi:hypothetical protein